jgi:hypothetical protein
MGRGHVQTRRPSSKAVRSVGLLCDYGVPQKSESFLDRVSTGSGSDLVSDQHAIFPNDFLTPMVDQVATAPCTDPIQVRFLLLRAKPWRHKNSAGEKGIKTLLVH